MSRVVIDECRYDASRGINYYTERLAAIMQLVGGAIRGGTSTHVYTKEIRRAMEALVYAAWDRAEELIPDIARAHVPAELASKTARECFANLLEGLLKRFREEASDLPMGARIQLMNMLLSSIAEMARYGLPPGGSQFKSLVFPKSESMHESQVEGGVRT